MKYLIFPVSVVTLLITGCTFGHFTEYWASAVEGRIVAGGLPVAGVQIEREVWDNHGEGERRTQLGMTDRTGLVVLPDLTKSSVIETLGTAVYLQRFSIVLDGKKIKIWECQKVSSSRFSEYSQYYPQYEKFFRKVSDHLTFVFDIDSLKPPNKAPEPTRGTGAILFFQSPGPRAAQL